MSNTFNYNVTAKRVTDREVASARLAPDYAALVEHFALTHNTDSKVITATAQQIVLDGAHQSDTKIGQSLTLDDLKGRDPGADAKHRDYWKAARAVRIGLVTAMGDKPDENKEATLRATLSGEGGGTVVIPLDSDLAQQILAFMAEGK